ncbi:MAG TPA: hypothetical protein VKU41_24080 [Polyangiaceae bacterium]|nr:hypothetical protein [Polyangiaceae bacterium]
MKKTLLASILSLGAPMGCASPHMVVPPDVGPATTEVHVDGHSQSSGLFVNEDFKIGDFAVAHVSRGSKSTSKFGAFGAFKSDSSTGYSFDLVRGADSLHGECVSESSEGGASLGSLTISNKMAKLGCACGNAASPTASVVMSASTTSDYGGSMKVGDATYEVKAINDREGGLSSGGPAGYRVDGKGVTAAVDVLGPGRVWLGKSLEGDSRTDVTCILAGLILYKPPKK